MAPFSQLAADCQQKDTLPLSYEVHQSQLQKCQIDDGDAISSAKSYLRWHACGWRQRCGVLHVLHTLPVKAVDTALSNPFGSNRTCGMSLAGCLLERSMLAGRSLRLHRKHLQC